MTYYVFVNAATVTQQEIDTINAASGVGVPVAIDLFSGTVKLFRSIADIPTAAHPPERGGMTDAQWRNSIRNWFFSLGANANHAVVTHEQISLFKKHADWISANPTDPNA